MTNLEVFIYVGAALLSLISGVIGWWCKELWNAHKELHASVAALKEDLPISYVRKDDFQEFIREFRTTMERLFNKLDSKADK